MLQTVKTASAISPAEKIAARAARAAEVAAAHANAVDAQSRFPTEAMDALKAENLLGIMVPASLGGEEASVADVVDVCYTLGRACSSTGMICCGEPTAFRLKPAEQVPRMPSVSQPAVFSST